MARLRVWICLSVAGWMGILTGLGKAGTEGPRRDSAPPFFALCMDTHDAEKRDLQQQARMLKELGYDGAGHIGLDGVRERLRTLDQAGLRLFQIYVRINVGPSGEAYDPRLIECFSLLKGRGTQVALTLHGLPPGDPSGDPRAVSILWELADLAAENQVELVLYPHTGDWVQAVEHAVRVAEKVDRPNLGVMFNLCHWLRVGSDRDFERVLRLCRPWLRAVSINGADEQSDKPDWSEYIQPLGEGSFDVLRFLRALREIGYAGPIGLQCYGIPGDAAEHLAASMGAWRRYQGDLSREPTNPIGP
ncbi:sugar phosphate isomerase/epimerase family protein [Thermopirellula anaerolimosa]